MLKLIAIAAVAATTAAVVVYKNRKAKAEVSETEVESVEVAQPGVAVRVLGIASIIAAVAALVAIPAVQSYLTSASMGGLLALILAPMVSNTVVSELCELSGMSERYKNLIGSFAGNAVAFYQARFMPQFANLQRIMCVLSVIWSTAMFFIVNTKWYKELISPTFGKLCFDFEEKVYA